MIDYAEIIENLQLDNVKTLLNSLEIPFREVENALIMPTVCHNIDINSASWKLYYYKDSHMFVCFTEDGPMSIFKFLRNFYETRQIEYDWYEDILQVIVKCSASTLGAFRADTYKSNRDDYMPRKSRKALPQYNAGVLDIFQQHFYPIEWINDHIQPETMDKFNIRYSISQNKIIIPHYSVDGQLVGIRGRALNTWEIENIGKYAPVWIEGKCYSHPLSLNLYGLNFNKQNIKDNRVCYLFESEKSVMQMDSFSTPNCGVAICGSNVNKFQIDLLVRYCVPREIIICLDNEEKPNETTYFDKLYKMCQKYIHYSNISFIYDRHNLTKPKDSPTDCGEEVFRQLVKERIKIK